MKNEETGPTALMIPALEASTELVTVAIRPAARDHLLQFEASQTLVAIHEAGHACAAAAMGIGVRTIDITPRHGGYTQLSGPFEDTSLPCGTAGRVRDNLVVALAGSAAERQILGEPRVISVGRAPGWLE